MWEQYGTTSAMILMATGKVWRDGINRKLPLF